MLSDKDILLGLEKLFKNKSALSSKGLCYALWQAYKPSNEQNKRIMELLEKHAETPLAEKYKIHSYWWPVGQRAPRLATIQRVLQSLIN